jgi:hypothetical protein
MLFFEETKLKLYLIATLMDSRGNTIIKYLDHRPKDNCSRSATAAGTRREMKRRDKVLQQDSLKL